MIQSIYNCYGGEIHGAMVVGKYGDGNGQNGNFVAYTSGKREGATSLHINLASGSGLVSVGGRCLKGWRRGNLVAYNPGRGEGGLDSGLRRNDELRGVGVGCWGSHPHSFGRLRTGLTFPRLGGRG